MHIVFRYNKPPHLTRPRYIAMKLNMYSVPKWNTRRYELGTEIRVLGVRIWHLLFSYLVRIFHVDYGERTCHPNKLTLVEARTMYSLNSQTACHLQVFLFVASKMNPRSIIADLAIIIAF